MLFCDIVGCLGFGLVGVLLFDCLLVWLCLSVITRVFWVGWCAFVVLGLCICCLLSLWGLGGGWVCWVECLCCGWFVVLGGFGFWAWICLVGCCLCLWVCWFWLGCCVVSVGLFSRYELYFITLLVGWLFGLVVLGDLVVCLFMMCLVVGLFMVGLVIGFGLWLLRVGLVLRVVLGCGF